MLNHMKASIYSPISMSEIVRFSLLVQQMVLGRKSFIGPKFTCCIMFSHKLFFSMEWNTQTHINLLAGSSLGNMMAEQTTN
jgi:hypothetical protein